MPFSGNNNNNIANLRQYKLLRSVSNILEMSNLSRPIIDAAGLHYLLFFGVRNCSHTHTHTHMLQLRGWKWGIPPRKNRISHYP